MVTITGKPAIVAFCLHSLVFVRTLAVRPSHRSVEISSSGSQHTQNKESPLVPVQEIVTTPSSHVPASSLDTPQAGPPNSVTNEPSIGSSEECMQGMEDLEPAFVSNIGGPSNVVRGSFQDAQVEVALPFLCNKPTYNKAKDCLGKTSEWLRLGGLGQFISAGSGGFTVLVESDASKKVTKLSSDMPTLYKECMLLKRLELSAVPNVIRCESLCLHGLRLPSADSKPKPFLTVAISPFVENAFQAFMGRRIDDTLVGGHRIKKSITVKGHKTFDEISSMLIEECGKQYNDLIDFTTSQIVDSNQSTVRGHYFMAFSEEQHYPLTWTFDLREHLQLHDDALLHAFQSVLDTGFKILQAGVVNMDLKSNILYTPTGDVTFIDFGGVRGEPAGIVYDPSNEQESQLAETFVHTLLKQAPKSWWRKQGDHEEKARLLAKAALYHCRGPWTDVISAAIQSFDDPELS